MTTAVDPADAAPARPRGREALRAAVLESAADHFARRGTRASLREIAADAGVNLGLIHRHFGNKSDLLQAVLDEQRRAGADVVDGLSGDRAMDRLLHATVTSPQHVRTLAWLALDADPELSLSHEYPAIVAMRARVGDDPDAQLRLMAAFTVIYGWTMFGQLLLDAFGHDGRERSHLEDRLGALLDRLVTR